MTLLKSEVTMTLLRWTVAGVLVAALGGCQSADTPAQAPAASEGEGERGSKWGAVPEPTGPILRPYPYLVDFPYEVVPNHFKPNFPEGWDWASGNTIVAESPNRVYVFQTGLLPKPENPVAANGLPVTRQQRGPTIRREFIFTVFDGSGNRIEHWTELDRLAYSAHGLEVDPSDPEQHIWLVNQNDEPNPKFPAGEVAILKYTRDGQRVMTIGSDVCRRPQELAFLPNGDFWCLSGMEFPGAYKYSKDGKLIPGAEFATTVGSGPGEVNGPHGIIVDRQGRILLSDRGNNRIQVFDGNGKYIESWPNIVAGRFALDKYDRLWVVCAAANCGKDLAPFSMSVHDVNDHGKLLFNWGVAGGLPGQMYSNGQFDVDSEGNFYMGQVDGGNYQKWRPRAGANPAHLIPYPIVR